MASARFVITVLLASSLFVPGVFGSTLFPVGPVVNGGFEDPALPASARDSLAVVPCVGFGHQALYKPDTLQGDLERGDSDAATARVQSDPEGEAMQLAGIGHCGNDATSGSDLVWVDASATAGKPAGWSYIEEEGGVQFGYFFDSNPFDREVRIPANAAASNHNIWQAFPMPHQAFSLDFASYDFRIERGSVAPSANIQLGFSLSPAYMQHPWVGAFWEGALVFHADKMVSDANGLVSLDPVRDGRIVCPSGYPPCDAFKADYAAADDEGKRVLLGQARLVQNSFWNFNRGSEAIVIDDVEIRAAVSAAEHAARGNINLNPGV